MTDSGRTTPIPSTRTSYHDVYRTHVLEAQGIHIDKLERQQWPGEVIKLANFLTHDNFHQVLRKKQLKSLVSSRKAKELIHTIRPKDDPEPRLAATRWALEHTSTADRWREPGPSRSHWRNHAWYNILDLLEEREEREKLLDYTMSSYKHWCHFWDESSAVMEGTSIATPHPDIAFGLLSRRCNRRHSIEGPMTLDKAGPLDEIYLDALSLQGLHPRLIKLQPLCYPCFIYEVEPTAEADLTYDGLVEHDELPHIQNRLAGAAAQALGMLRELEDFCLEAGVPESSLPNLPVLALCSQGYNWWIYIAFSQKGRPDREQVHLVKMWEGSIQKLWGIFQVTFIVHRFFEWVKEVYKPQVEAMLESLRPTIKTSYPMASAAHTCFYDPDWDKRGLYAEAEESWQEDDSDDELEDDESDKGEEEVDASGSTSFLDLDTTDEESSNGHDGVTDSGSFVSVEEDMKEPESSSSLSTQS